MDRVSHKMRDLYLKRVKTYAAIICEIRGKASLAVCKKGMLTNFLLEFLLALLTSKASSDVQKNPMLVHLYSFVTSAERSLVALAVQLLYGYFQYCEPFPRWTLLSQAVATVILHGSLARCH